MICHGHLQCSFHFNTLAANNNQESEPYVPVVKTELASPKEIMVV